MMEVIMSVFSQPVCRSGGKKHPSSHPINEDYVLINRNYAILMDGATGLGGPDIQSHTTNAEWLTQFAAHYIGHHLDRHFCDHQLQLVDVVAPAIAKVGAKLRTFEQRLNHRFAPHEEPSSSLIILRDIGHQLQIFSLGDSIVMFRETNGELVVSRDQNLVDLDDSVLRRMRELATEQGIDVIATRAHPEIEQMLIANRAKKNTPGGYWIFGSEPTAIHHAREFLLDTRQIDKVICLSDGFDYEALGLTAEEFFDQCTAHNLTEFANRIERAQLADAGCNQRPRFKLRDDCSGFVWTSK